MNVSKELCKELYELSGWADINYFYPPNKQQEITFLSSASDIPGYIPAYNLSYLLCKLPQPIATKLKHSYLNKMTMGKEKPGDRQYTQTSFMFTLDNDLDENNNIFWEAQLLGHDIDIKKQRAVTPEDATCMLVIELFKQGVLK